MEAPVADGVFKRGVRIARPAAGTIAATEGFYGSRGDSRVGAAAPLVLAARMPAKVGA